VTLVSRRGDLQQQRGGEKTLVEKADAVVFKVHPKRARVGVLTICVAAKRRCGNDV